MTSDTADISKYLDFGLYEKICFKVNDGLSLSEPGDWLWISHRTRSLMCYHIIVRAGKFVFISMVKKVTNIDLSTDECKETFLKFDS